MCLSNFPFFMRLTNLQEAVYYSCNSISHRLKEGYAITFNINYNMYQAIKLICNRVIHESEIVCRFLNKKHSLKLRLNLGVSIEKWMIRL
jgi:hypothetical protein